MIRSGEALPISSGYDPLADEQAAKASHKAQRMKASSSQVKEEFLSKKQLEDLRRVQNERIEAGKMKQLGIKTSKTFGVRMDGTQFDK